MLVPHFFFRYIHIVTVFYNDIHTLFCLPIHTIKAFHSIHIPISTSHYIHTHFIVSHYDIHTLDQIAVSYYDIRTQKFPRYIHIPSQLPIMTIPPASHPDHIALPHYIHTYTYSLPSH